MSRKRTALGALLMGALGLTGCCSWCENHCPTCHPATAAAYQPAPVCCQPATTAPVQPVPAYAPPTGWPTAPQGQRMNCTCTAAQ